jgi:hypothetical protein
VERLIDLIYETVADPSLWPEVTRVLAREVGATAAWMGQLGRIEPVFFARDGLSADTVDEYIQHFADIDLLVREWRRRPHEMEGRVIHIYKYVDERTWLGSEIHNDWCRKAGIGDVLTASLSPATKAGEARFITFFQPPGEFFQDAAIQAYHHLLPHLFRAARLRDSISQELASVPNWTAALLEQLPSGVFLLDRSGREHCRPGDSEGSRWAVAATGGTTRGGRTFRRPQAGTGFKDLPLDPTPGHRDGCSARIRPGVVIKRMPTFRRVILGVCRNDVPRLAIRL